MEKLRNSSQIPSLIKGIQTLQAKICRENPQQLSQLSGFDYCATDTAQGFFSAFYFGTPVTISFPELVVRDADGKPMIPPVQAFFLYYLDTCNGILPGGGWVSFSDLPDGRIYVQAFQGYTGNKLALQFGDDINRFEKACLASGGQAVSFGDRSFQFTAFPRMPLMVTCWLGEDEFPTQYKILFDSMAGYQLPIDACAVLGSMLVSRIIKFDI